MSPMISFRGTTKAGPFYDQILDGRKTQTIREPRQDGRAHVKVGDICNLYWKVRAKKSSKPVHLITSVEITAYEEVTLLDMWDDEENAKADGFKYLEEFRDWFLPDWRWGEIAKMIEAIQKMQENIGKEETLTIVATARRAGKSTAFKAFKELTAPLYRIKWRLLE